MTRFVPYEKRSKKAQCSHDRKQRGDWGGICPVTRTIPDARAYKRHPKHKGNAIPMD